MLPQRERAAIRNDGFDRPARARRCGVRQRHIHLAVLREGLGIRAVDARPVARHRIRPLLGSSERSDDVVPVAHDGVGGVDEQLSRLVGEQRERGNSARRKRFHDRAGVIGITGRGTVGPVLEHEMDTLAVAIEASDVRLAARSPIDADRIRTETRCLGNHEERARRIARQLEQDATRPRVEIDWKESVPSFEARGAGGDRGADGRRGGRGCRLGDERRRRQRCRGAGEQEPRASKCFDHVIVSTAP